MLYYAVYSYLHCFLVISVICTMYIQRFLCYTTAICNDKIVSTVCDSLAICTVFKGFFTYAVIGFRFGKKGPKPVYIDAL